MMSKKLKTVSVLILTLLCAFILAGCGQTKTQVTDLQIKGSGYSDGKLSVFETKETKLTATTVPEGSLAVTWVSKDPSVATVENGVVRGISVGTTNIEVTAGDFTKTIPVEVKSYIPMTAISFESEVMTVPTGVRKQLNFTIAPEHPTYKNLIFEVSPENEGVTVTSGGMIEVASNVPGNKEFIITARSFNEKDVQASIKIIVEKYELQDIALVSNDFHTEITELTVPLDEPYRVLFQMAVPEKAIEVGGKIPTVWTSSNESVCKVNDKGRLTFHSVGTAIITMKAMGFEKQVAVTVTEPEGKFIGGYYLPSDYLGQMNTKPVPSDMGLHKIMDFNNGGSVSEDAKRFLVCQNYKPFTGPSSWFAGGGFCIEMGGWDNIHSGLEDDDMPGGGEPNLYMWFKVALANTSTKVRAHFYYRQTDATFKYKLRLTVIDPVTNEITHLCDWQTGDYAHDDHLSGGLSYIEADIPEALRGKTVVMMLEYDDIDYTTDGILNGCESVNIDGFSILNFDGETVDNALWVFGDSIMTTEFTGSMVADIAQAGGYTLFRDTISGSTVAPASGIGIVDHIDSGLYENGFEPFGSPSVILITRGTNDVYWSSQEGNPLKMGNVDSTDKTQTYGAIRYTIEYLQRKYPDAEIIWANSLWRADVSEDKIDHFNANLKTICDSYGVQVLDLKSVSGINESNYLSYLTDGIHPNANGITKLKEIYTDYLNSLNND